MSNNWLEEDDAHWRYFLALEDDLIRLSRFIELSPENFEVHSIECTRLFLATCSEIEVVLKATSGLERSESIHACIKALGVDSDLLLQGVVILRRGSLKITPWHDLNPCQMPSWWRAHNRVKHDRGKSYRDANLRNTIDALCALFIALVVYLRRKKIWFVMPAPTLLKSACGLAAHEMCPEGTILSMSQDK